MCPMAIRWRPRVAVDAFIRTESHITSCGFPNTEFVFVQMDFFLPLCHGDVKREHSADTEDERHSSTVRASGSQLRHSVAAGPLQHINRERVCDSGPNLLKLRRGTAAHQNYGPGSTVTSLIKTIFLLLIPQDILKISSFYFE